MKKFSLLLVLAALLSGVMLSADEKGRWSERKNRKERTEAQAWQSREKSPRIMQMSQPVYAGKYNHRPAEMTPEQRKSFEAARKRRFEIMVLIGAYKIMPEDQRQNLKNELLKRIEADFQAVMAAKKARIARAEADLQKLRSELAQQEAQSAKLVERELDRLLKMPMPGRKNRSASHKKTAPEALQK
ncbi:MAG: hypothetical protein IKA65_01070 [Lentisphaeria bacterium]|nr:hypothetical protein [Lentisphaeria bacterium]